MAKTKIKTVRARRTWDLNGAPAIEVEVTLRYGARGTAVASALDISETITSLIDRQVTFVNETFNRGLKGKSAAEQEVIDQDVLELASEFLDHPKAPNLVNAVSQAILKSAADSEKLPLWQYLGTYLGLSSADTLPLPIVAAPDLSNQTNLNNLIETVSLVPVGAKHFSQALDWCHSIYALLASAPMQPNGSDVHILQYILDKITEYGLEPGRDMALALKINKESSKKSQPTDAISGMLVDWVTALSVVSIETPFSDQDIEAYRRLTWAIGKQAQVFAPKSLSEAALTPPQSQLDQPGNASVVNTNSGSGISSIFEAKKRADECFGCSCLTTTQQDLSGELAMHLAIGWGVPLLKFGEASDVESLKGWQEGLRNAETIAGAAPDTLPAQGALPPRSLFAWK